MVLPYRGYYGIGPPGSSQRRQRQQDTLFGGEEPGNSEYYKPIFKERYEPPTGYERIIDQQPLRPGDLIEGEASRQAPDPFGVKPFTQASWTSPSIDPRRIGRIGRSSIWQEAERLEPWNPYYRKDLTGGDDEISLEDALGEKPQKYVPAIDQQPLRPGDLFPGDSYRQAPDPFGVKPFTQASWTSPSAVVPPDKPQQDTQSVAAVFGGPQSGATAMVEDPRGATSRRRYEAARIAREAFSRDPDLVKEFLPKLRDAGVDPALGAPEGWSLPEAPETWQTPGGTEQIAPSDPWSELDADWQKWNDNRQRDTFPPGTGIPGPAVPGGLPPQSFDPSLSAMPMTPEERMNFDYRRSAVEPEWTQAARRRTPDAAYADLEAGRGAALGGLPQSPLISRGSPDYRLGAGLIADNFGRAPQPRPEEQGPPQPISFAGNMPRPRPDGIPAQFADLRNGPRDITRGLIAGGQEARLPQPRPDYAPPAFAGNMPRPRPDIGGPPPPVPSDLIADRISGADQSLQAEAARQNLRDAAQRANAPPNPMLERPNLAAGIPVNPLGSTVLGPSPSGENSSTAQLPYGSRLIEQFGPQPPTPPRLTDDRFYEPPAAAIAAPGLPRPRPAEQFGPPMPMEAIGSDVPGPQSSLGLPDTVMASIRKSYDPRAIGGPDLIAEPEELPQPQRRATPTDWEVAKKALQDAEAARKAQQVTQPPPAPPPAPPPITEQQVIDDRPALIAPSATSPINPNLSPREIEKRARTRGFGTVENLTGDRWARGIGAGAGVATGLALGNPLLAAGLGVRGYQRGDDVRRSYMNRSGLFGLGNIFGRGRDKDKNKDKDTIGTPPSSAPAGVAESMGGGNRSGSGSGSDRGGGGFGGGYSGGYGGYGYGGAPYPGYGGYGGGYGPDTTGGAYRNR